MNRPQREGFIEGQPVAEPGLVDITPEKDKPVEHKARPMPPPEIKPSPAEQQPDSLSQEWPITVKLLYKPIRNGKEQVHELVLREPRAGDINRYGNPIRINGEGEVVIDERKMTYMIAALSGILPPFIEDMHPRDWNSCAYRLQRFFLPDPAAW